MAKKPKIKINKNIKQDLIEDGEGFLIEVAEAMETEARSLAPRKSGKLASSIDVFISDDQHVSVGSDVEYARVVEYGSRNQQAQPYLRPALDRIKSKYE